MTWGRLRVYPGLYNKTEGREGNLLSSCCLSKRLVLEFVKKLTERCNILDKDYNALPSPKIKPGKKSIARGTTSI
jgi:hypothetical protein